MMPFRWRSDTQGSEGKADLIGWLDSPSAGWGSRIIIGVLLSSALAFAGVWILVHQKGWLIGSSIQRIEGRPAIGLGLAVLGAGVFAHAQAFWGPAMRLAIVHQLGRLVGALAFVCGFFYMLFAMFWL